MNTEKLELMAHLLRRAGFGATRAELDNYAAQDYGAVVEELLNPGDPGHLPDDLIRRYQVELSEQRGAVNPAAYWMYRMITTSCPLEEKIALFWHGLFATAYSKLNQATALLGQVEMFRRYGLGNFRDLLVQLSKDPAMIMWLDNIDNHKGAVNENYGRELLELFSMGIGNYTEEDVKECARAFTGWTLGNAEYMALRSQKNSIWPYGRISWHFEYREQDHDDGVKTFLGETGRFNGEDIIDIIARQEATGRFVSKRLFQYFVSDEVNEDGEKVIQAMTESYFESGHEIRSVLRAMFNSGYFKSEQARFARVKGPAELVAGAIRLAGSYRAPTLGVQQMANQSLYMGQGLFQPPSVEGWHEGAEWINSGALLERVNFAGRELSNVDLPGVRAIIQRLAALNGGILTPEQLVDGALEQMGFVVVSAETRATLVKFAGLRGDLDLRSSQPGDDTEQHIGNVLRLIVSTREFQFT